MADRRKRAQPKAARRKGRPGQTRLGRAGAKNRQAAPGPHQAALAAVARFIEALGQPAAVIGGVAVIAHGHARTTADVDIAVAASPEIAGEVLKAASSAGLVPRIKDAKRFAEENLVLLLRHRATSVEIDVSFALQHFEIEAAGRAVRVRFGSVELPVTTLEALLIYKMVASRPQDVDDVEALLARNRSLDSELVMSTLRQLDELLATDRAGEFRRLLDDR